MHFRNSVGADTALNFSSGIKAYICLKSESYYVDLTDTSPKGYSFRAFDNKGTTKTYGIFSFSWASDQSKCTVKCTKRIKGYICNSGVVNGTWSWSAFDWSANSSHAYNGYDLVVTDIID